MKKNYTAVILIFAGVVSCKINAPGVAVISGDFIPPKLVSVEIISETEINLAFTKAVQPGIMTIGKNGEEALQAESDMLTDNSLRVKVKNSKEIGQKYVLRGTVTDSNGNTLSFLTEFSGFNARVPKLILSEVRTEYTKPKVEFIELYVQSAGNLAGVTVYNSYDGDAATYEFPPAEVKAGEYIVLHLRTMEEGTVDETGAINVSQGTEAFAYARDFWDENTSARLGKSDVFLLRERKNGALLDALLLTEAKNTAWTKTAHADAAKRAFENGVWLGGSEPAHAVIADTVTTSRTISRQGNLQTATAASKNNWIIVDSGGATPGKENSTKPYVQK